MLILNLETEDFTVTAKEHNSNNISDVLSITVKQRKTKKEINYSVKKELYAKVIKIILEKGEHYGLYFLQNCKRRNSLHKSL